VQQQSWSKLLAAMKNFAKTLIMKQQTSATTETGIKIRNIVSYAGKTIFVGIDVHKKDWQVATFCEGMALGNHRMKADCDQLIRHLRHRYPDASLKCVYESCAWGFELHRDLKTVGIDCIVAHAADVPGSNKEFFNKDDSTDAMRLARHYAGGLIHGIYIPQQEIQKHRNLIRFRKKLVNDLSRSKNRLKSLLKYEGIIIPAQFDNTSWSNNFLKWIYEEGERDILLRDTIWLMLEQIKQLRQLLLKAERKVRELARDERYNQQARLLMSIPGIGCVTAMLLLLEIGNIRRFKSFDQLNSFVGFYPGTFSSGERNRDTGLSFRRHNQLRTHLVEASWQLLRRDPAMMECYQQLIKKMKGSEAIIRIARKLLRRIRAILLDGRPYQVGVIA
jgi:transposase